MNRILTILGSLLVCTIVSAAEPGVTLDTGRLTLEEAWRLCLERSNLVAAAQQQIAAAQYQTKAAKADLLPRVGVSVVYTRLSAIEAGGFEIPGLGALEFEQFDSYTGFGLTVEQPIFVKQLYHAVHLMKKLELVSLEQERAIIADLRVALEEAYYGEIAARGMVQAVADGLATIESYRTTVERMQDVGLATKLDFAQIQVRRADLEVSKVQVESAVKLARLVILNLTRLPLDSQFALDDSALTAQTLPTYNLAELVDEALATRPDIKTLELSVQAAQDKAKIAMAALYPTVGFQFGYDYDNPNQRYYPQQDKFLDTWDAAVAMTWNVWDFMSTSNKAKAAKSEAKAAEFQLDNMRDAVRLDVYQRLLACEEAASRMAAATTALNASQEALRVAQERYEVGDATTTDVLDAQASVTQAQFQAIQAKTDCLLAQTKLDRALGRKTVPGQ